MATENLITIRSNTNFTIDVTVCNLLDDLNIKDFIAIHDGQVVSNNLYNKTTFNVLTYVGPPLDNTTIEIRRKTPNSRVDVVTYGSKLSSSTYNEEMDRAIRWREEVDLNYIGSGISSVLPNDTEFGSSWSGDVTYPPTRNAVYNIVSTLAPISLLNSTLASYAPLNSPTFTGIPTFNGSPAFNFASYFYNSIISRPPNNTAGLSIRASNGFRSILRLDNSNGTARWEIQKGDENETGSNAGSNFTINRYNDAGSYIDFALTIKRDTGEIFVPGKLYPGGIQSSQTITASQTSPNNIAINCQSPAGTASDIKFSVSSSLSRWQISKGSEAESGGNAGSNFAINRYNDAGSYLGTPVYIYRDNGNIIFNGSIIHYGSLTTEKLRVTSFDPPATSSSTGTIGEIKYDTDYIYVCTATNTWKRAALSTW